MGVYGGGDMINRFTTTRTSLIRRFTKAGGDCRKWPIVVTDGWKKDGLNTKEWGKALTAKARKQYLAKVIRNQKLHVRQL